MSMKRKSIVITICQEELTLEAQNEFFLNQEKIIAAFFEKREDLDLHKTFFQLAKKQKNRNRWVQVIEALQYAENYQCDVVFSSISQHHSQIELGEILIKFFEKNKKLKLYCIDQAFISENNICEIIGHFLQRRRKHGQLIKEGLQKTHLKSGNPQASQVIAKVNKPKILCSVVYALFFEPILSLFEAQNLAQRKIVLKLNEEGFCAPEGGKWVLSQYQKVLERVRINRMAFAVGRNIEQMLVTTSYDIIAHSLAAQYPLLLHGNKTWTPSLVKTVLERYQMLQEIEVLNERLTPLKSVLLQNQWTRLSAGQIAELIEKHQVQEPISSFGKVV